MDGVWVAEITRRNIGLRDTIVSHLDSDRNTPTMFLIQKSKANVLLCQSQLHSCRRSRSVDTLPFAIAYQQT